MAQFDLFHNPNPGPYPLLLDIQADLLSSLATRVVVPLAKRGRSGPKPIARLNPVVKLGRTEYLLIFQELAAVPLSVIGPRCGSLASRRTELIAAIDLLFTGL